VTSVTVLSALTDSRLAEALAAAPWEEAAGLHRARFDEADAVVVVTDEPPGDEVADGLAHAAGRPVLLVGPTVRSWGSGAGPVDAAGVSFAEVSRRHEIRVRSEALDPRAEGDLLVVDALPLVDKVMPDVETLATAAMGLSQHPVATWRPATGLGTLTVGSDPQAWRSRRFLRLLRRLVDHSLGRAERDPVRVGLLGYGAIGHEHARACTAVPGLDLVSVCDSNPARVEVARGLVPSLEAPADGNALLDSDVELVVVSTPPDSHAGWALAALERGKHVVLEKPMALSAEEADAVLSAAAANDRHVVVYQNRRWDADFLALQRVVDEGRLGEVFHLEAFVGGHGHPCNYWHSDAGVSGGAIFDWGSHYLDQVLLLMGDHVAGVTAANHKRVWHDVTNADHSRLSLTFDDGAEATFIHSDLAAALKPKWYVLGTEGAVVGHWRQETVVARTDIGTLDEDRLAPADSPAALDLHHPDGSVTRLATPPAPPYVFHRELADRLVAGLPMSVSAQQSREVVAVMEAAESSAASGGTVVVPS
jgi:predicted dehydrogenase